MIVHVLNSISLEFKATVKWQRNSQNKD